MQQFLTIYLIILFGYYLVPASFFYLLFYVIKPARWKRKHIQQKYPTRGSVLREIKWSMVTVIIFSVMAKAGLYFIEGGKTKMYFTVGEYGYFYLFFSLLAYIFIHDTYFYWIHRLMHLRPVFKWVHKTHHLSHTPSPFASLAFSPPEAVLQFSINLLMIFIIPLHPAAFFIFATYNMILNTAGHIGFEIVPSSFIRHWFFKYGLTVTHHDMHHSRLNCNYGLYFIFWDKLMGTNHKDYEKNFLAHG